MSLSLAQVQGLSISELAAMSASDLMHVQAEAAHCLRHAKERKDWIDGAIALKYESQAKTLRSRLGKDTGTVHFEEDGIQITSDLPKKLVWDQQQLAEIAARIAADGDDPAEYLEITYKVAERKYTAWPENLRRAFAPARTLKMGKATFKLRMVDGGEQ